MHYRTLTSIVTLVLLVLVILLFIFPTAGFFMLISALVPVLIAVLAIGVLRAPEKGQEPKSDRHWYDLD